MFGCTYSQLICRIWHLYQNSLTAALVFIGQKKIQRLKKQMIKVTFGVECSHLQVLIKAFELSWKMRKSIFTFWRKECSLGYSVKQINTIWREFGSKCIDSNAAEAKFERNASLCSKRTNFNERFFDFAAIQTASIHLVGLRFSN